MGNERQPNLATTTLRNHNKKSITITTTINTNTNSTTNTNKSSSVVSTGRSHDVK